MQLRGSLRWYFFASMLFLALSLSVAFSGMAVHNFIEGLDTMTQKMMIEAANQTDLNGKKSADVMGFNVARTWEDLPKEIQQNIHHPPDRPFDFEKAITQHTFFQRPTALYFAIMVINDKGEQRFVSKSVYPKKFKKHRLDDDHSLFSVLGCFAIAAIVLFAIFVALIIRSVSKPVEELGQWAKSLNAERLPEPPPHFRYNELNALADVIRGSLISVHQSLEREQAFVKHASHELRTPIASIRSNIELLEKMLTSDIDDAEFNHKKEEVAGRIHRAAITMSHLTETLLWLSRDDEEDSPEKSTVSLDVLVDQLADELKYLLNEKPVTVEIKTESYDMELPYAACRIVLSNLIRNAFQHTDSGTVSIHQKGSEIEVINHIQGDKTIAKSDLGFGLGLKLTQKLTERLGWEYVNEKIDDGRKVSVRLENGAGNS